MSKWLDFREQPRAAGLRTKLWSVFSKKGGGLLGTVGWYATWRRHCFQPVEGCVFDPECLRDIAAFMEQQTREHRAK